MRYLGRISGHGALLLHGESLAGADFDFEGFVGPRGAVTCSGEILSTATILKSIFAMPGVQLRTDAGRMLNLRFTEKKLIAAANVAHVAVTGDLPAAAADWRSGLDVEAAAPA